MNDILLSLKQIGLTHESQAVPFITDEPKIHNFISIPNEEAAKKYTVDGNHGQGYDYSKETSEIKSIAECLERLCLDNPDMTQIVKSQYSENENQVDPGLFVSYSDEQVGNRNKFIEKVRNGTYQWFPATDLNDGTIKLIPGQIVFISDTFRNEFGIRRESISTGAAFGEVRSKRAQNSGFHEAIERDSCIYAYIAQKNMPKIKNLTGKNAALIEYLKRYNLETHILDATSDLRVPTSICILVDRTGIGPAVDVGSATDFTHEDSIYRSIMEAAQCRRHARIYQQGSFSENVPKENEIHSLEDRFVYWQPLERINDLRCWLNITDEIDFKSLHSDYKNSDDILKKLLQKGFNVYEADITLPELKEKGFETKKIIIPQLHPLYLDERSKMLYSGHYGTIKDNPDLKPHPLT